MVKGRIRIVEPQGLTEVNYNIIPRANNLNSEVNSEYEVQKGYSTIGLTWRDFTIDAIPYDFKYKEIVGVKVIKYGSYNPENPHEHMTGSVKPLLHSNVEGTNPILEGMTINMNYNKDILDVDSPTVIRSEKYDTTVCYLLGESTKNFKYVKYVVLYEDLTESQENILYTYSPDYTTNPSITPISKYKSEGVISKVVGGIEVITLEEILTAFEYRLSEIGGGNTDLIASIEDSGIKSPIEHMFTNIFEQSEKGIPLKITVWDTNNEGRLLLFGQSVENGMSIPFEYFNRGYVVFDSNNMVVGDTYKLNFSFMELITGNISLTG